MLTNGTTIAVTSAQQDVMRKVLGFTPTYGRAVILGSTVIPEQHKQAARAVGLTETELDRFEAYVVEPKNADGSDLTADDFEGATDRAYVVLRNPDDDPMAYVQEIGNLPTSIIADRISKSQFLATVETTESALVEQFRAELEDDLNQLAAEQDDDLDPGFVD